MMPKTVSDIPKAKLLGLGIPHQAAEMFRLEHESSSNEKRAKENQ